MSSITDIPIEVGNGPLMADTPSAQLLAILQELQIMLTQLVDSGTHNSIDIRSLPLLPGDYGQLKMILGEGEVRATVNSLGPSEIVETGIPGIWWISHRNAHDEVVAELIEVTTLPTILELQPGDLDDALAILNDRLVSSEHND